MNSEIRMQLAALKGCATAVIGTVVPQCRSGSAALQACRSGSAGLQACRSSQKRFWKPTVDRDDVAGGLGALISSQPADGVRAVERQNRPARNRPLCIEVGELAAQRFGRFVIAE